MPSLCYISSRRDQSRRGTATPNPQSQATPLFLSIVELVSDAAMLSSLLLVILNVLTVCVAASSDYYERLLLRPLPQSALLTSFNFRSNESLASFEEQNFRYFPRSLGQILQHAHTKELHLRFSTGRWDAASWGTRPWNGAREGGTGVELWAWIEAGTEEEYASHV
jgi:GPI-anchor transamidase subunit T